MLVLSGLAFHSHPAQHAPAQALAVPARPAAKITERCGAGAAPPSTRPATATSPSLPRAQVPAASSCPSRHGQHAARDPHGYEYLSAAATSLAHGYASWRGEAWAQTHYHLVSHLLLDTSASGVRRLASHSLDRRSTDSARPLPVTRPRLAETPDTHSQRTCRAPAPGAQVTASAWSDPRAGTLRTR